MTCAAGGGARGWEPQPPPERVGFCDPALFWRHLDHRRNRRKAERVQPVPPTGVPGPPHPCLSRGERPRMASGRGQGSSEPLHLHLADEAAGGHLTASDSTREPSQGTAGVCPARDSSRLHPRPDTGQGKRVTLTLSGFGDWAPVRCARHLIQSRLRELGKHLAAPENRALHAKAHSAQAWNACEIFTPSR